jgi:hypothetical protein
VSVPPGWRRCQHSTKRSPYTDAGRGSRMSVLQNLKSRKAKTPHRDRHRCGGDALRQWCANIARSALRLPWRREADALRHKRAARASNRYS